MIIALDFDETYTCDPILWNNFIKNAMLRDHHIYCVTFRHVHEGLEVMQSVGQYVGVSNVIFTGRKAKRKFCGDMGVYIDVWIDDSPEYIVGSY